MVTMGEDEEEGDDGVGETLRCLLLAAGEEAMVGEGVVVSSCICPLKAPQQPPSRIPPARPPPGARLSVPQACLTLEAQVPQALAGPRLCTWDRPLKPAHGPLGVKRAPSPCSVSPATVLVSYGFSL